MCDPLSAAAGAAMVGSTLMNKMGADAQSSARNGVLADARNRQQSHQQQATDKFNSTLPLASRENAEKNAGDAAGVRKTQDQSLLSSIGAAAPVAAASAPKDVVSAYSSAVRDSGQRGLMQADANAKVGGVHDANQKLGIDLTRAGEWQKIFGSNMAHDAALVPGELNNANYAGGTERGIGQVLGAVGQAAGTAALMGGGGAGGGSSWSSLFGSGAPVSDVIAGPTKPGFFTNLFAGGYRG